MRSHWYRLFWTLDDCAAHEFQSQGGFIVTCAFLSLACNDPQNHSWLPGLGIELDDSPLGLAHNTKFGELTAKVGSIWE